MTLNCELIPCHDAAPDDLKRLGAALKAWFDAFLSEHAQVDGWLDQDAVNDLLAGELPLPFVLRCLGDQPEIKAKEMLDALDKARTAHPLLDRSLPTANARSILFGFSLADDDQGDLLASMKRCLPMEVVERILIGGESQEP